MGFYGLFHTVSDRWIWRNPILRGVGLIKTPDLNGIWKGCLRSSIDQYGVEHQASLKIMQTWSQITVILETEQSRSHSLAASILIVNPADISLSYEYLNEPRSSALTTMNPPRRTAPCAAVLWRPHRWSLTALCGSLPRRTRPRWRRRSIMARSTSASPTRSVSTMSPSPGPRPSCATGRRWPSSGVPGSAPGSLAGACREGRIFGCALQYHGPALRGHEGHPHRPASPAGRDRQADRGRTPGRRLAMDHGDPALGSGGRPRPRQTTSRHP
jgi:SMODS-associating 2TM, beta-strand rich effector domain